jgi:ADP-heptose:LPS heptosyltransferase
MHLAAAAGAPTLGLFGPTPVAEYAPAGRLTRAVSARSGRMEDLTVDQAFDAAAELVAAAEPACAG